MSKKNPPTVAPTLPEKKLNYKLIGFSLLSLVIGGIGGYLISKNNTESLPVQTKVKTETYPKFLKSENLVSPFVELSSYKKFNDSQIIGLDKELAREIKVLKADGNAKHVSVYFKDLTNDYVIGYNEDELFAPASLMKVPIMITILKLSEEVPGLLKETVFYKNRRESEFVASLENLATETILIPNSNYTVNQLLEIMIIESDNEATICLLDFLKKGWPGYIEKVEKELNIPVPFEGDVLNANFISVKKYSSIFRILYNASYLTVENSEKALRVLSKARYGYGIRQSIPSNILISQKFGIKMPYENLYQTHHFAIVYHPIKPFMLGIMTRGESEIGLRESISSLTSTVYRSVLRSTKSKTTRIEKDLN